MVISKELKRELDKQVKNLINVFKKEFLLIKSRAEYNDDRSVYFISSKKGPPTKFFFGEEEEEKDNFPKDMREFVSVIYNSDKIVISINYKEIYQGGFFRTTPKIFLKNLKFYENVVMQIARHEYGHSFLNKSDFDAYPKIVRTFLKEINCDDIFEVPESQMEDLKESFKNSDYGKTDKFLETIQLNFVEKILREFHADYSVCNRIDSSTPTEALNLSLFAFQEGLRDLPKWEADFYSSDNFGVKELSNYFFFLLILTQIFFVYNAWNMLKEIFKKHNLEKLLGVFHLINGILKKIILISENFDGMRKHLYELAKILDSFQFEKLFFENDLDQEKLALIRNYIQILKIKSHRG